MPLSCSERPAAATSFLSEGCTGQTIQRIRPQKTGPESLWRSHTRIMLHDSHKFILMQTDFNTLRYFKIFRCLNVAQILPSCLKSAFLISLKPWKARSPSTVQGPCKSQRFQGHDLKLRRKIPLRPVLEKNKTTCIYIYIYIQLDIV